MDFALDVRFMCNRFRRDDVAAMVQLSIVNVYDVAAMCGLHLSCMPGKVRNMIKTDWTFIVRRTAAITFIVAYLSTLSFGVATHALGWGNNSHPLMYFIVWDMFCGWSSFASSQHIVAEGESGELYELTPPPWGEFKPYGHLGRQHYDIFGMHFGRYAANVLKHSKHEPMTRVWVIEKCWSKKYDLPADVWQRRYDESQDDREEYYSLRVLMQPDGTYSNQNPAWLTQLSWNVIFKNESLRRQMRTSRSVLLSNPAPASWGREMTISPGALKAAVFGPDDRLISAPQAETDSGPVANPGDFTGPSAN